MKWTIYTVLTILLLPFGAQGQTDTVRVGDERIDASYLQPFEVRWTATKYFPGDSTVIIYRVNEKVEVITEGNKSLLRFTQHWNDHDHKNIFTTVRVADLHTMAYVAFHTGTSPGGMTHLDFDGRYVSGFIAFDAHRKARPIGGFIDEPVFASFAGLLYAVVLKDFSEPLVIPGFGYGGENPVLNYEKLEIIGEETILFVNRAPRKAKVIKSTRSPSNTYWIDSAGPPYFLKAAVDQGDGTRTVYEIIQFKLIK